MEEQNFWLACRLTLDYLSHTAQAHLPRDGIAHNVIGPPASVSSQSAPRKSQTHLMEAIPSFRDPLSKCVKSTTKISQLSIPKCIVRFYNISSKARGIS